MIDWLDSEIGGNVEQDIWCPKSRPLACQRQVRKGLQVQTQSLLREAKAFLKGLGLTPKHEGKRWKSCPRRFTFF
jgi:hypothetical protein